MFDKYGKHYVDYVLTIEGMEKVDGSVTFKSVSKLTGVIRYYNDGTIKELYPTVDENLVMSKEIEAFIDFVNGKNLVILTDTLLLEKYGRTVGCKY